MIARIKSQGLGASLENHNRQSFFLIKNANKRQEPIGFTTDVLIDKGGESESNIEAMGMLYRRGRSARGIPSHEEVQSFESDDRFERFTWKSESAAGERTSVEIELDTGGLLTVSKFGPSVTESGGARYSYHTSNATVPDILLEQLLARMIEDGLQEILIDMVTSYGEIIPTYISQIRPESAAGADDAVYLVKLMPMDGRGHLQLAYLDEQKRISESLVRGRETLILERTTPQEAARAIPERRDYILQEEKIRQYLKEMEEMI